ncbi:MAG: HemK2/MTQ2 family protein methyltransferase [Bacteroidota bacterium]
MNGYSQGSVTATPDRAYLSPFQRWVRRVIHAFLYHLWVKPAITRVDTCSMLGLKLTVPPSVFHPKFYRTSRFFAGYLSTLQLEGREILEIGSGSGILSLIAARKGAVVTAVDINPHAVQCTRRNAESNGLQNRISVVESDLFKQIGEGTRFDYIIWSPPFYPREAASDESFAWNAGPGYSAISRFAKSAGGFLRENGCILFLLSSEIEIPVILSFFREAGLTAIPAAQKKLPFEMLTIYAIRPSQHDEH